MSIELLEIDQDWQNETTKYWFDVDGETYAIADSNGETTLLDSEGYPIDPCNDHQKVNESLIPHYELARDSQ